MIPQPEQFEIIDAHTHPFLDPKGNIGNYNSPVDMEEFDREMKRVGIKQYAGSPIYIEPAADFKVIQKLNEDALRIRDQFPAYIPGIQVHGSYPEESVAELHRLVRNENVRYIGELVPYLLDTGDYHTPGMIEILKEAGKMGLTASLDNGTEEAVVPVMENCPGLNVILAHPGEPGNAKKRFEMVAKYPNLYMDVSGYGLFRWNMLRYAIDVCGAEKMIFGSDMPTCSPGMYLYGVLSENLTDEEFRLVLGGNFKRLLGLK